MHRSIVGFEKPTLFEGDQVLKAAFTKRLNRFLVKSIFDANRIKKNGMPLFLAESLIDGGVLGIWEITESVAQLAQLALTNRYDRDYLAEIHHPERYRQTLASRVLARQLLAAQGENYPGVAKDSLGKPYLPGHPYHISLSHTKGFAAVLLHPTQQVGIDIEEVSDKLGRVMPRFLTKPEQLEAGSYIDKIAVYWCAKEAVYKVYRPKSLSFKEIRVKDFHLGAEGTLAVTIDTPEEEKELTVYYRRIATFSMAWVLAER